MVVTKVEFEDAFRQANDIFADLQKQIDKLKEEVAKDKSDSKPAAKKAAA